MTQTCWIVSCEGGWAYEIDGVSSAVYPTRQAATNAARQAVADEPRTDVRIRYEDDDGGIGDAENPLLHANGTIQRGSGDL